MKNKVNVTIGGIEYPIIAADSEEYIRKVAAFVEAKNLEVSKSGKVSVHAAMVLTALTIGDEYFKSRQNIDSLRAQLKDYADEAGRAKAELADLRRENDKLKAENTRLRENKA